MLGRIGLLIALVTVGVLDARAADKTSGSIEGLIESAKVTSIVAVNRASGERIPGKIGTPIGKFGITGLPLDATYDLIIDFAGSRLEGINLKVPRSDYVEEQPLSEEDIETIRDKAMRMNKFEDVVEIRTVQGNIQHAAVLLNKLRTRPFFASQPGEVIWRAELWHFERPEETWVKVQEELAIVLYRERIQSSAYTAKSHTFDQALGGIELTSEQPTIDLGLIKPPITKPGIHFRATNTEAPLAE
ncbi:MAG: hypothetical protein O3C40_27895 [Planctomycetota bacterium]|nr:hypothetical protein [Planctomycetota bacterium]